VKSKFNDSETAHRLIIALSAAKAIAQELSIKESSLGTPFEIHKSLNILYKELRAHEIFIRALADGDTKKKLREADVEVIKPQSWRFYTRESLRCDIFGV